MLDSQKKTFPNSFACAHQWTYPVINLGRNEFRNCCKTEANTLKPNDLTQVGSEMILNSPAERNRRARMLLGEKISSCSSCWVTESKKVWTPRVDVNLQNVASDFKFGELQTDLEMLADHDAKVQYLAKHPATFSTQVKILDIILTNTCDMQCMYCSHHYSSKWAAELVKYNEFDAKTMLIEFPKANKEFRRIFLDWFKAEGVHIVSSINFIGGEPSLIKDFYEISKEIANVLKEKRSGIVMLSVVTNLNSTEAIFNKFTSHLIAIAEPFREVDLNISIEAFGKRAEYIRHGLNWERWQINFEKIVQVKIPKVKISAQMATNILSISSLPELLEYFVLIFKKYDVPIFLKHNLVSDPPAHAPMLLTPEFTDYIDKALQIIETNYEILDSIPLAHSKFESSTWKSYRNFLKIIRDAIENHSLSDAEKKIVRNFFNQFNERRNLDMYKIFPEYEKFLFSCGVIKKDRPPGKLAWIRKLADRVIPGSPYIRG